MPSAFHAFLSHRYKSPDVNEYFYAVCAERTDISFEVDAANGATNVTRLQRLIRGCHGFVGVFPLEWSGDRPPTRDDLRAAFKYFRLELGLAARARKPMLVFADRRFGAVLDLRDPEVAEFDYDEVVAGGASPNRALFSEQFGRFLRSVEAGMAYDVTRPARWRTNRVGVLLPSGAVYAADARDRLHALIDDAGGEAIDIASRSSIDGRLIADVESCDWVVVDLAATPAQSVIVSFLEGSCVPLLRILHAPADADGAATSPIEQTLYGSFDVGFAKDIVRWSTVDGLIADVADRLQRIQQPSRRISTSAEARRYFHSAAPRTERVFVSYRGSDATTAAPIVEMFRRRFQQVFDYKDGESIGPGRPWLDEIFNSLDKAALAVLLLSPDYVQSQNCLHEAQKAIELHDSGRLHVLPIKLPGTRSTTLPSWLTAVQAMTYAADPAAVVERAIALLSDAAPAAGS